MGAAKKLLTPPDKERIVNAIRDAEKNTSGEIRVHIEDSCEGDVLDQAAYIFDKLKMKKTDQRNGVLFYLSAKDRKFAILGDAGINQKVPEDFWDQTLKTVLSEFKEGRMAEGLIKGIHMAGQQLKRFFPYQSDDVNELTNDISFGETK